MIINVSIALTQKSEIIVQNRHRYGDPEPVTYRYIATEQHFQAQQKRQQTKFEDYTRVVFLTITCHSRPSVLYSSARGRGFAVLRPAGLAPVRLVCLHLGLHSDHLWLIRA